MIHRVAVTEFENQTGDDSLRSLGTRVADTVAQGLAEIQPGFSPFTLRPGDAIEVLPVRSLRSGAGGALARIVITGALYRQGPGLEFRWTATDTLEERVLHSMVATSASRSDPEAAIDETSQRIMGLVATLLIIDDLKVWKDYFSRPPRYEAHQEYMAGFELFIRDPQEAAQHFRRASTLDPDYAYPDVHMAYALSNVGRKGDAYKLVEKWAARREDLAPRNRYSVDYLEADLAGRRVEAFQHAKGFAALVPSNPTVAYLVPAQAVRLNRPTEAIEAYSNADHFSFWWQSSVLCAAHHLVGEHEREAALASQAREKYTSESGTWRNEARALAALGKLDELRRLLDRVAALPGVSKRAGAILQDAAATLRAHGFTRESLVIAERSVEWYRSQPVVEAPSLSRRMDLARALYLAEQLEAAEQLFVELALAADDRLRADPKEEETDFDADLEARLYLGVLAARRGDRQRALEFAEECRGRNRRYLFGLSSYCRGAIAAHLGELEESTALLSSAYGHGLPFGISRRHAVAFEPLRGYAPFEELMAPKG